MGTLYKTDVCIFIYIRQYFAELFLEKETMTIEFVKKIKLNVCRINSLLKITPFVR
jgi:hypothetical protein